MRRSLLADLAARDNASVTLTLESTGADGEPQTIQLHGEGVRALESGFLMKDRRRAAWKKNALCVECECLVDAPEDAGVLKVADVFRVAHRKQCFARAVSRANPTFSPHVAATREASHGNS